MSDHPHRILAVATDKHHGVLLAALRTEMGPDLEAVITLGGRDADYKASSLLRLTEVEGKRGHIMDGDAFSGRAHNFATAPEYADLMLMAMDNLERGAVGFSHRPHPILRFHDALHYINIVADRLGALLDEHRIDTVLFFDMPHLFYDLMLYAVARMNGVDTVIAFTSQLKREHHYTMRRMDDFGHLSRDYPDAPPWPIDRTARIEWDYMKGVGQERGETGGFSRKGVYQALLYFTLHEPRALLRPAHVWRTFARMKRIGGAFPAWRDPFARFFRTDQMDYFEALAAHEDDAVDLSRPFVYYAMHFQPEMTTAAMGERYNDQLLAVERVAEMAGPDVLVYVKENPKQSGKMRSPMFYHRMRRIPNVRIMPSHTSTHALTDNALAVATISGSVGWEAICRGKPVLVFGNTWYQDLPGVLRYAPGLTLDRLTGNAPDHAALERAVGQLAAAARPGETHRHRARALPDDKKAGNPALVATSVADVILGRAAPSFGPRTEIAQ